MQEQVRKLGDREDEDEVVEELDEGDPPCRASSFARIMLRAITPPRRFRPRVLEGGHGSGNPARLSFPVRLR